MTLGLQSFSRASVSTNNEFAVIPKSLKLTLFISVPVTVKLRKDEDAEMEQNDRDNLSTYERFLKDQNDALACRQKDDAELFARRQKEQAEAFARRQKEQEDVSNV